MAERSRKQAGFNTPFGALKKLKKELEAVEERPSPRVPVCQEEEPDDVLFARAVQGVARLPEGPDRVPLKGKESARPTPDDDEEAILELESLVRGEGRFEVAESEEAYWGRAPGVNRELLEKLQAGQFSFRRHLDLHGLSREEARLSLQEFIQKARREGERCVLVVTGRGRSSPDGRSVLREALPRWLSRSPLKAHVIAFSTARQVDGGAGATYVLLRRLGLRPYGRQP